MHLSKITNIISSHREELRTECSRAPQGCSDKQEHTRLPESQRARGSVPRADGVSVETVA